MRYSELHEDVTQYNLDAKYREFNSRLFANELPQIPVRWASLKNVSGKFEFQVMVPQGRQKGYENARLVQESMVIKISNKYIRTEDELDAILVHEMIHVLMAVRGHFKEQHGPKFMDVLNKLNQKTSFDIPLVDKVGALQVASSKTKRVLVLLLEKPNGQYSFGLLSCKDANTKIEEVRNRFQYFVDRGQLKKVSLIDINSIKWSRYAEHFPVHQSLKSAKFWLLNQEDQDEMLDDLKENGKMLVQLQ